MKKIFIPVLLGLALLAESAHADDPKTTIAALDTRLTKLGEAKLEGTDKAGELTVPVIYFGTRKINNNYDVVDEIKNPQGPQRQCS